MSYKEFLKVIEDLSKAQGFYGRLLRQIEFMTPKQTASLKAWVKKKNFKDALDVVMAFEA
jgi:tryptophan 2,3-dioxygenase